MINLAEKLAINNHHLLARPLLL